MKVLQEDTLLKNQYCKYNTRHQLVLALLTKKNIVIRKESITLKNMIEFFTWPKNFPKKKLVIFV